MKSLNNRKLNKIFSEITSDDRYSEVFWKYFDDGWHNLTDIYRLEKKYRINRIIEWCEENYIPYYLNKRSVENACKKNNPMS